MTLPTKANIKIVNQNVLFTEEENHQQKITFKAESC